LETKILNLIKKAVRKTKEELSLEALPPIEIEVPQDTKLGDIATNIALKISRQTRKKVEDISILLLNNLKTLLKSSPLKEDINKIESKNGFINFFLSRVAYYKILLEIKKQGSAYGSVNIGNKKNILLEFVSANPTGPLSVAHGRQAAIGETLANILKFVNFTVKKEYYINDEGKQIDLLGESTKARCLELMGEKNYQFPADGYRGQYIYAIARQLLAKYKPQTLKKKDIAFFSRYAVVFILSVIKDDLNRFGVNFDSWFYQSSLAKNSKVKKVLNYLKRKKYLYEKEGAVWFKSTLFSDDRDRVLIKRDGSYTYITPDIAYHRDKKERGFEWIINIWGPDHHGYILRLKAACSALGIPEEILHIIIVQLCTLRSGGKPIKMSTREGEFVTLRQVIEQVGNDAAKFFFLMRRTDSHLDFDLELARKKTLENPIYYIQYAHARICSIMEFKKKIDIKLTQLDLNYLVKPEELEIIRSLRLFPLTLINIARTLEPHTLTLYLRNLASLFHGFYQKYRVVQRDEPKLTAARLLLIDCVRQVLANGLSLLGISAPSKM
jgi:arginyl-tRNA synthetase